MPVATDDFTYPTREARQAQRRRLEEALELEGEARLAALQAILAEAEGILAAVFRRQMGGATSLDAREMVRQAERYLGLGVRRGQAEGWIETADEARRRALLSKRTNLPAELVPAAKVRIRDIFNVRRSSFLFAYADAPAEAFAAAVAACRQRGTLAQIDLVGELRRLAAAAAAARPELLRGRRHLNVNHTLTQVIGASGVSASVEAELDWGQLDEARLDEYSADLRDVINSLYRLKRHIDRRRANRAAAAARKEGTSE